MAAIYVHPAERITLPHDIAELGDDSRRTMMPEFFALIGILSQKRELPIGFEVDLGRRPGRTSEDEQRFSYPIATLQHQNGLVEIKPGVETHTKTVGKFRVGGSDGEQADPILYLPLIAETLCIIHEDITEETAALGGIISVRTDASLYQPHRVASFHITR